MNLQIFGCLILYLTNYINTEAEAENIDQEIKRYQKTLLALHEKINSVVNLEWRINKLEATLQVIEENRHVDDGQTQTLIDVTGYGDGNQYAEERETLSKINKTVIDAMKNFLNIQKNMEQVQLQVTGLNEEVSSLDEWRRNLNLEEQAEQMTQMSKQLGDIDLTQQDLNTMTRHLQNETHDLRGDVANVNDWVRRMQNDFHVVFDSIRANLSEMWKENQDNASDKTFDIVETDNP